MRLSLWTQGALVTPKQERFVAEYLIDLNATQAAIRAGYSPETAKQQGSRLLTIADVKRAVESANQAIVEAVMGPEEGSAAWIVAEAVRVVRESETPRDRVPALSLLAKRFPEFRDRETNIDARSLTLNLPDGTTLDDLKALRDGLKG